MSFQNKRIAVLGLGRSGLSATNSLLQAGAHVLAWDDQEKARGEAQEKGFKLTDLNTLEWKTIDALVLSPGIPHHYPAPHPVVAAAKAAECPLISDIEILCLSQPKAYYIGITGTNGKSTTTALIGHALRENKRRVEVGGNIGIPALELAPLEEEGVYVVEMSSYQLELTPHFHPNISVLLNITPDHLDRHGGMEGYVAAKELIHRNAISQDIGVISIDDPYSLRLYEKLRASQKLHLIPVSLQMPLREGVSVRQGVLYEGEEHIGDIREFSQLKGEHNWQNIAIAYAVLRAAGSASDAIIRAIKSFSGLVHRQQVVGHHKNVTFVNDSKGTSAEATSKALACYQGSPLYVLLGGQAKEGGISSLRPYFPFLSHAFLYGAAARDFAQTLEGQVPYTLVETLEEATHQATEMAVSRGESGAVVLLSPACASFDQFRDFEERGEAFCRYIKKNCDNQLETLAKCR